jgi:protein-L-isoaspartate(D-aspartate) O-methyltransferase
MASTPSRPSRFPASLASAQEGPRRHAPETLRPQRPLRDAAASALRRDVPAGLGLDSETVRLRMIERLRDGTVAVDPIVLEAMARVPRHLFVDSALATQAYEDTSLPIGHGQTISKPTVVARMISLLRQRPSVPHSPQVLPSSPFRHVLEIGTGCGYQAAVLSLLARRVTSVERIHPLHERARIFLRDLGLTQVRLVFGDGRLGHPGSAPFDAIIAAAGGDDVPTPWLEQLAVGGRLVAPTHSDSHGGQVLLVIDRDESGWHRSVHDGVHFVPLESGTL